MIIYSIIVLIYLWFKFQDVHQLILLFFNDIFLLIKHKLFIFDFKIRKNFTY